MTNEKDLTTGERRIIAIRLAVVGQSGQIGKDVDGLSNGAYHNCRLADLATSVVISYLRVRVTLHLLCMRYHSPLAAQDRPTVSELRTIWGLLLSRQPFLGSAAQRALPQILLNGSVVYVARHASCVLFFDRSPPQ
jgi:hypothetical protein